MVVWDWTLASIRPSELPLFIPVFFSFGGMIIPLPKPKLYSIPRFENEKEKKKKNQKQKIYRLWVHGLSLWWWQIFLCQCGCSSGGLCHSKELCSLSFWLQFTDLSGLSSFILKAIKWCFNVVKQIERCFPNQNPKKEEEKENILGIEIYKLQQTLIRNPQIPKLITTK